MKVDKELDERTSGDSVFQTRAAAIGKARSPTVDRFDVGSANVSDDHDRSRMTLLWVLQDDVETALACTDVTQLDVSSIVSVSGDPQQVLRARIKRQMKFITECRDMKVGTS